MRIKLFKIVKLIVANYLVFITLLITIEIFGQFVYRFVKGRYLFENTGENIFREHPYLSAAFKLNSQIHNTNSLGEKMSITINHLGYRTTGSDSARNKINVVCLGGSTTFGTNVTDEESWPYLLQEKLGSDYKVFNLGVPGYSTMEAIIQLTTIVPELDPDYIIIYEGWNDIRSYHAEPQTPDYYWHGMSQKSNLQIENKSFWNNFFVVNLTRVVRERFSHLSSSESAVRNVFSEPDRYVDSIYTRNLKTIKILCDHLHSKSIFIPQILNVEAFNASGSLTDGWTPKILNKQMPVLMSSFNALMVKTILEDNQTQIANVLDFKWQSYHFADNGHFNKKGGEVFAKFLRETIQKQGHEGTLSIKPVQDRD